VIRGRLSRSPVTARLARHPRGLKLTVWPRRRLPLPNVLGREVFISNTFNIVELATAEAKATGLAQDVVKASEKSRLQILRAPVNGKVQQFAVHTVGGGVTPAQALLEVVPLDSRLEIEAKRQADVRGTTTDWHARNRFVGHSRRLAEYAAAAVIGSWLVAQPLPALFLCSR
jgi:hypothetical protein